MVTVAESAAAQMLAEFDEAAHQFVRRNVPEAELTDTGRINQVAARRQMVSPCESSPSRVLTPGSRAFTSADLPTPL